MSAPRAIIVLAAGASRRLGRPKQLLKIGEETLLRRAARTAIASGVGRVYVVLARADAASVRELAGLNLSVVENADAARGMGTSVRAAVAALPSDVEAAMFMLVDQPAVTPQVLAGLSSALNDNPGAAAAATAYAGTTGVPAIFRRELFDELLNVPDDEGAKSVLLRRAARVVTVEFPGAAADIDTAEDLDRP